MKVYHIFLITKIMIILLMKKTFIKPKIYPEMVSKNIFFILIDKNKISKDIYKIIMRFL